MADELDKVLKQLDENSEKIDAVSKELVMLKHQYRTTKDRTLRVDVKSKWDKLQKKMDSLEKKRRGIIEKKNEIEFKRKWKGWK